MRDRKLIIYQRTDVNPEYYALSIEKLQLKHIRTTDLSKLQSAGIVAFAENENVKIFIKKGSVLNKILPQNDFLGEMAEELL